MGVSFDSYTIGSIAVQIDLQRLLNYLLLVLSIVGGIISGMMAGRLIDLSFGDGATLVTNPTLQKTVMPRLQEDDFQVILNRNLFNSAATGEAAEHVDLSSTAIVSKSVAATGSIVENLVLIGTVVAGDHSLALIQSGSRAGTFKIGDELVPGVVVTDIGRKLIVLKDHGVRHELPLKPSKGTHAQQTRQRNPASSKPGIVAVDENSWKISKAVADNARANLGSLLQTARMIPQVKNGKTVGFELVELKKGSLLEKIGLRVGDLVVEINQVKLNSPGKALQIFQQVREAKNITLSLMRNGKPKTFEYSFE
jgi:general secretion pathway protein C